VRGLRQTQLIFSPGRPCGNNRSFLGDGWQSCAWGCGGWARRLRTIPGIGPFLSLALALEIGDINRFPSATQLRGYSGLVPAVHQSGDKDARGPLTKTGNKWLRYAAVQGAQRMSQMRHPDPRMKRIFLSVSFRRGCNPGKIAAARRLLDMIYYLLTQKEDYQAPATATAVRQA